MLNSLHHPTRQIQRLIEQLRYSTYCAVFRGWKSILRSFEHHPRRLSRTPIGALSRCHVSPCQTSNHLQRCSRARSRKRMALRTRDPPSPRLVWKPRSHRLSSQTPCGCSQQFHSASQVYQSCQQDRPSKRSSLVSLSEVRSAPGQGCRPYPGALSCYAQSSVPVAAASAPTAATVSQLQRVPRGLPASSS